METQNTQNTIDNKVDETQDSHKGFRTVVGTLAILVGASVLIYNGCSRNSENQNDARTPVSNAVASAPNSILCLPNDKSRPIYLEFTGVPCDKYNIVITQGRDTLVDTTIDASNPKQ